nr:hypothetical protein [Tanacetum cinerariifolium]
MSTEFVGNKPDRKAAGMDESSPMKPQEKMSTKSGVTKSDSKGVGMVESSQTTPSKKMSIKYEGTNSVSKAAGMAESSQTKPHLFLEELDVDVTSTIVVMIGKWLPFDLLTHHNRQVIPDNTQVKAKEKMSTESVGNKPDRKAAGMDESSPMKPQEKMSTKSEVTKSDSKGVGMAESSQTTPSKKMSIKYEGTNSVNKAAGMAESSQTKPHLFLEELEVDVTSTIVVMIGRVWDVNALTDRYLSTDLVVSDSRTATFHCKVMIENIGTKKGWNYPLYGSEKYQKVYGIVYHRPAVFTMQLLNCSDESLLGAREDEDDESNLPTAIRNLIGTTHVLEIKSHTYYENPSVYTSVYTPSKPIVENKKRRTRLEDFDADEVSRSVKDLDKCNTDGALDKKKKRKDCSCSEWNVEDKILVPKPPKDYARCGHPVNGPYCQGCALLREKLEEDLVTYLKYFQDTFESSDDSTNVVNAPREPFVVKQDHGVKSSQNPPLIDECCCECGNALDGIYCQQCICKSCGKGAHIGYNRQPKVPIISNSEPCNQTMNNELPQTLPSFDSTCYSNKENSVPCVSKPNFVNESSNIFNPPPQPPIYYCELCESNAQYGHYCTPQVPFINPEPGYSQYFNFSQNIHNFQQQYLCCDQYGGPHETF